MFARQTAQRLTSSLWSRTPRLHLQQLRIRSMVTSTTCQAEFLCIIPDKPGVREKRLEVRPKHFDSLLTNIESGGWKMGGALLNEIPKDDDASKFDFMGSALVVVGESKEDVISKLKADIYTTSGVWDLEKAEIYPFKCAFRRE